MKSTKNIISLLLVSVVLSTFTSCNKNKESLTFQSVFEDGGLFEDPMNTTTKSVTVDTVVNGDSLWACSTETYN